VPLTYYKINGNSNGTISFGSHTHTVNISGHQHTTSVPGENAHSHSVATPSHTHPENIGIKRTGNPKNGKVFVNGTQRTAFYEAATIELTEFLKGPDGLIPRDQWIIVGVLPDDRAYIKIDVMIQGFVQARGGGSY
jgi:hypothetical protein